MDDAFLTELLVGFAEIIHISTVVHRARSVLGGFLHGQSMSSDKAVMTFNAGLSLMGGVKQRMPLGCLAEKSPPCDPHLWVPRPRQPCSLSPQAWGEGCGFLRLLRPQLSIHSSPLCHPRLLPPAQVACDCSEERQLESDTTPLNYSCFF